MPDSKKPNTFFCSSHSSKKEHVSFILINYVHDHVHSSTVAFWVSFECILYVHLHLSLGAKCVSWGRTYHSKWVRTAGQVGCCWSLVPWMRCFFEAASHIDAISVNLKLDRCHMSYVFIYFLMFTNWNLPNVYLYRVEQQIYKIFMCIHQTWWNRQSMINVICVFHVIYTYIYIIIIIYNHIYIYIFHSIPFLLYLVFVLSCRMCDTSFDSRQISSERMRNGIGTLKVTTTGVPRVERETKRNEFLVIPSASLTWCRPLSFKRRSWRRHFSWHVSN